MPFIKNSDHARAAGRLGGFKTRQRLEDDPNYFSRIGTMGGKTILQKFGPDHFSAIGKLPKKVIRP